jgi:hypothetical protein
MDNVQNCDRYINIPLSQTYRSYFCTVHFKLILGDVLAFSLVAGYISVSMLHIVAVIFMSFGTRASI